jgi:hypothetical protein
MNTQNYYNRTNRIRHTAAKLLIAACLVGMMPLSAFAIFTPRSVTLSNTAASATATHKFDLTAGTTGSVGSIQFLYCTAASGACTTPAGLSTTSATLAAQGGATGFTIVNTTQGAPYITRTAASITSSTAITYTIGAIANPSTTNQTFFIRISSHTTTNATGAAIETSVVATSTATQIVVTAQVDEILTFCVYTGANCAAGGASVDLGVLTPASTGVGVSYMDVGTNAGNGFAVQYNGPTLTSGGNTIQQIGASAAASTIGLAQFGINATGPNTTPAVTGSQAPTGVAPIGNASSNYNTTDQYAYVASTPTTIANSTSGSNTTKFSVSYIANINSAQAAGAYTSTITYICTGSF